MKTPLVSVVIPTFGRTITLKRAVDSVLQQTYTNIEIIIVDDNGCNSVCSKGVRGILDNISHDIKYIQHEINKGGCAARNTGIKYSKGDYIAFLDDDDEWSKEFVKKLITILKRDFELCAVYSDFFLIRNFKKINFNMEYHSGYIKDKLIDGWCPASTSLFLLRKSCILEVGGFDEDLVSFQDFDLWLRLSQKYLFFFYNEKLTYKYEHKGQQVSLNPIVREAGLKQLNNKWLKQFEKNDYKRFKKTIDMFRQGIYLIYLKKSRLKFNIFNICKYFFLFNISKPFRTQNIFKSLLILVDSRLVEKLKKQI